MLSTSSFDLLRAPSSLASVEAAHADDEHGYERLGGVGDATP